jgi:hypothetical protein
MTEATTYTLNVNRRAEVFIFNLSDLIDESRVVEKVLEHREQFPISDISNVKGWHSGYLNYNETSKHLFDELIQIVRGKFSSVLDKNNFVDAQIENCWAIVYDKGDGAVKHNHSENDYNYAAVYYAASDPAASPLKFEGGLTILPESGMLVIFPGWLKHEVPAMRFNCQRIAVAFNIRCTLNKHRHLHE